MITMQTLVTVLTVVSAALLMVQAGLGKRQLAWRPQPARKRRRRPGAR
ncbi:MAG TPA: hypothetical protein VFU10_00910 [Gaiellaceae bacterium]|nr:hypothetical protein [Gaiellaceae bacterium]